MTTCSLLLFFFFFNFNKYRDVVSLAASTSFILNVVRPVFWGPFRFQLDVNICAEFDGVAWSEMLVGKFYNDMLFFNGMSINYCTWKMKRK